MLSTDDVVDLRMSAKDVLENVCIFIQTVTFPYF